MRDIILTLMVTGLVLATFRHPVVGAYLWAWLSLMNPHKLTYGFANALPFAQVCAVVTLVMLLATRQRRAIPLNAVTVVHITMLAWMTFTSFFAIAPTDLVIDRWIFVMKIQIMMFVTMMLIVDAKQLRILIWIVVLSIAFYGIKGGAFTIATGGAFRVWGPPGGMVEENNALAVCLVMLVPIMYFLQQTETRKWLRHLLVLFIVLVVFSILGSQSRGALLSVVVMALFLGLKGKHPIRMTLVFGMLVVLAIIFMPESWTARMQTLQTYNTDDSAMSRIWTWNTLWNVAMDRPFLGAGLQSDTPEVFARYAPLDGEFWIFAGRVYVAHSIYFQMLGEHGFPGLILFLLLGLLTWRMAGRVARQTQDDPEFGWMPLLMRMVQVSFIGFAVGGAFLSLAYFDVPYYFVAFVVLCDALVRQRAARTAGAPGASALPAGPALGGAR